MGKKSWHSEALAGICKGIPALRAAKNGFRNEFHRKTIDANPDHNGRKPHLPTMGCCVRSNGGLMEKPNEGRSRVVIENVLPQVNCGLFPIKRIVDDLVSVEADVFGDGHDHVRARLLWKQEGESTWQTAEMLPLGNDRWQGEFPVTRIGRYRYTIVGDV